MKRDDNETSWNGCGTSREDDPASSAGRGPGFHGLETLSAGDCEFTSKQQWEGI